MPFVCHLSPLLVPKFPGYGELIHKGKAQRAKEVKKNKEVRKKVRDSQNVKKDTRCKLIKPR